VKALGLGLVSAAATTSLGYGAAVCATGYLTLKAVQHFTRAKSAWSIV
jgi:hypothetical protein